ncbi:MAG: methyltransferase domain-containing protein [Anaerolineae bacterium]|nr:methyltransferase domain-containing protein [Anaerolineae bacterium]
MTRGQGDKGNPRLVAVSPDHRVTVEEWHNWFSVQANWTHPTRTWLYQQIGLARAGAILEVGCGTGVITAELAHLSHGAVTGLDIDFARLTFARQQAEREAYVQGDAYVLPFASDSFDIVACHYLLLWLADPLGAVREMARVTRPGGAVLVCAEPDYGGRIDHPAELVPLGQLQVEALRRQGANPNTGRRVGGLLAGAGLQATVGVMAGRWDLGAPVDGEFEAEWQMRKHDLAGLVSERELETAQAIDRQAMLSGRRLLFVPTFYGIGRKSAAGNRNKE